MSTQPSKQTGADVESKGTNIEGELRKLSLGGAGLFTLLVVALVMVLESLGSQLGVFESKIVPTERAVGGMLDAMGEIAARETAVLAATDSAAVEALGDDSAAASTAERALVTLEAALESERHGSLSDEFSAFRQSADDLTAAAVESHSASDALAAKLSAAQSQVAKVLGSVSALEGEVQLRYILLLREIDSAQSADAVHRLVSGNVRMIDERVSAARTMIEVLGRRIEQVALTRNRDELNSLDSNELAQAAAGAQAAIKQLGLALDDEQDAGLATSVAEAAVELERTLTLLHRSGSTAGLVDLRHAYFDAGATMRSAQAAGHDRSLSANATLEDVGADVRAAAAASQAQADAVVQTTRIGVSLLVLLGLGFCMFSGRRILLALKALRKQNADLAALKDELSEANASLEARVEARTQELAAREASTRLLLDSMGDGIFEVNAEGSLVGERSKAVDDWFGDRLAAEKPRIWNVLTEDAALEASVQFGWDQLFEDFLPFEVAADQVPRRFERDGRVFDVEYRKSAQESTVLVVVRDWTANEAAERAERESRDLQTLVGNLLRDREGFELTRAECSQLIETLEQAVELTETKRALHTLKGNTASYGFSSVAERCHSLEDMIAEEEIAPSPGELTALREEWESGLDRLKDFIQSDEASGFQLEQREVEHLRRLLLENRGSEEILRLISTWSLTPAKSYLTRLKSQARRVASSLAKEVNVTVNHNGVRVDSQFDPLWPLMIHLIRNSIDHGLESSDQREAAGKSRVGSLTLSAEQTSGSIVIEVADDGAGIPEDTLRSRLGSEADGLTLLEVIAHDGLSSKDQVTDLSGRGIGVGAVLSMTEELGGTIQISTTLGKGTCLRLEFPLPESLPSTAVAAA